MKTNKLDELFLEKNVKENELSAAITLYRHQLELQKIEDEISANKPVQTQNDNKFKRAIIDNTINAYRRNETRKLSDKKQQCKDAIAEFKQKCKENSVSLSDSVTEKKLNSMIEDFFSKDKFGFKRIYFAMNLCLQDDGAKENFIYGDETLKDISVILFDDETRINSINEKFFENFNELTNGSFWERNKYFLIGSGISLALVSVLTPVMLGVHAAGSAVVISCLSQIGHCAPGIIGAGLAKVTAVTILSSAVLYGGIFAGVGVSTLIKDKQVKEAFRQLKPDDLAALLAMKTTLVEFAMPDMSDEDCKTELNACLSNLNDLRADSEYMLIVEKSDGDNSKKKIKICNRFVKRLAQCVGI